MENVHFLILQKTSMLLSLAVEGESPSLFDSATSLHMLMEAGTPGLIGKVDRLGGLRNESPPEGQRLRDRSLEAYGLCLLIIDGAR